LAEAGGGGGGGVDGMATLEDVAMWVERKAIDADYWVAE
jgi:hypothetical protein